MTNLELTKLVEELQKEIKSMTICIGKMGQKQVRNDEMIITLRDEIYKLNFDLSALKRTLNTLINEQNKNTAGSVNTVY